MSKATLARISHRHCPLRSSRRLRGEKSRLALAWLVLLVSLAVAAGEARARTARRSPAQALGDAFRALEAQDFGAAHAIASSIERTRIDNEDYKLYVLAQSAALLGKHEEALGHFRALARQSGSRFQDIAPWRIADVLWSMGRRAEAVRAYRKLAAARTSSAGDVGLARFRIAEAQASRSAAIRGLREFLVEHPEHPQARQAEARLFELGGDAAARLGARERIARAERLTLGHYWHEAIAELGMIADERDPEIARERDYWTGMTLFKMRRRYQDAADILLRIYKDMGSRAARALFHGARALSRADRDAEAITWYQRVVAEYPRTDFAEEAQYLSGWLEFNMGKYRAAIPHLETMLARYGRSRWADDARWFLGFSHYLLGEHAEALEHFAVLARQSGRLEGGKGRYWHTRTLQKLGRTAEAVRGYRQLVGRYPLSWYAHLARARLAEQGIRIDPFGDAPADPERAAAVDTAVDDALARDRLIRAVDELLDAGLEVEAGVELRRGERGFLERQKPRGAAMAMLLDRYRRAQNFHRPWMLAIVHGGDRALDAAPTGRARVWWQHAYPLAYRDLVERWRHLGDSPTYYLYSIMHKESGFDPHTLSYADAIGLLQMIPPTTQRVVRHLGMEYTRDLLYDPEANIKTGSWYIGRLLHKFKGQIPFGAGSFNSGPRPVTRWMDQFGHLPVDEFVEMVPYQQTREYMKKVTETYSRYLYLYEGVVYDQPLVVDRAYVKNDLIY